MSGLGVRGTVANAGPSNDLMILSCGREDFTLISFLISPISPPVQILVAVANILNNVNAFSKGFYGKLWILIFFLSVFQPCGVPTVNFQRIFSHLVTCHAQLLQKNLFTFQALCI